MEAKSAKGVCDTPQTLQKKSIFQADRPGVAALTVKEFPFNLYLP